jgi:hypothetical protein
MNIFVHYRSCLAFLFYFSSENGVVLFSIQCIVSHVLNLSLIK